VGSTTATPTGEMITHPEVQLPSSTALVERIGSRTRAGAGFWADAAAITEDLFGNATTANLFVVGMAVQAGCLPVSAARLEEAIRLNGVAVEANLAAFRWGRIQVADPAAVADARAGAERGQAAVAGPVAYPVPESLDLRIGPLDVDEALAADLRRLASELVAWGGRAEASRWLDLVEATLAAEERAAPGSRRLTRTVAAMAYRLTAYKDEYEVARLMTDEDGLAAAREVAGDTGRLAWRLHPPILRALGLRKKIAIGFGAAPLVRLLAKGRVLRGTPFDVFGYAEVRRVERALAGEYRSAIEEAIEGLDAERLEAAIALAALPESVRGYEDLKLARVAAYREKLAHARAALR